MLQEIGNQFSNILIECKEYIRGRGELFEHSEQAHVLRSKISEIQANRKKYFRHAGDALCHIWREVEDGTFSKARRAVFGSDFRETYELLQNRLLFVEGGNDEFLFLEHYVLLGNFIADPDRFEMFDALLLDFLREVLLTNDGAEDLSKARKTKERLLEQARLLRSELVRTEEEHEALAGHRREDDGRFPQLFKRTDVPEVASAELDDLRRKTTSIEKNLAELAPQIDAAKQRVEFLADEYQRQLGDYLNEPENARRLFETQPPARNEEPSTEPRVRLEEWVHRLEERDLLFHVLASYEIRKIYTDYCPPIHLQQLKKALVSREEAKRVEQILEQYPARKTSMKKLDDASRRIRRQVREEILSLSALFAEDIMRLRRDRRNYHVAAACMERINLIRSEHSRELSRANKSLYEFLHPSEVRPAQDEVINHVVIKADVRGSTSLTKDLLDRGMNPASHFSMNLHEPVKRMLQRYGAAKVFIEGDAIILAIYETESNHATRRACARACVLAREILSVRQTYNERAKAGGLPPLELGVGIAFQDSAPSLWADGDSRASTEDFEPSIFPTVFRAAPKWRSACFKPTKPLSGVYLLQTLMDDGAADEEEIPLIRYNLNGIEINEEAFQKLSSEVALSPMSGNFPLPWGKERVQLFFGEVFLGGSLKLILVRKGFVRELLPGGKIGAQSNRAYYEVCTDPRLFDLARKNLARPSPKILEAHP